jgi:hypothetical protein
VSPRDLNFNRYIYGRSCQVISHERRIRADLGCKAVIVIKQGVLIAVIGD